MDLYSMLLINVKALLEREELMETRERVDCLAKVLELRDDEVTGYAILSHRWGEQEVGYDEIVELAKMDEVKKDEIRQRDGYQKILDSCKQAKKDGYEWLWVDTCCIDKRSSAELSEAINSMYRWYENAQVCYAYLHDVLSSSIPTEPDDKMYANGWPEWFSRGWTLQEMIAPSNVQFFNKQWQAIGDKRALARTLEYITGVPEHVLRGGLHGDRVCVAQIMSWAANRTTTRVEDRAYSLMGLLGVNMPMLYGEGKKAFHRLQLEIIRTSNDQSIFAWSCDEKEVRTGSILADDPSVFRCCSEMELMYPNEFIKSLSEDMPEEELPSSEDDRLGTFPITNRGIQIWLFLCPTRGSDSVFEARLPCRSDPSDPPVAINLCLRESNYYRCAELDSHPEGTFQFRQIYLRYQDTSHRNVAFEIDASAITKNGFTYQGAYPAKFTGNTFILTSTDPLCVKVYSNNQTGGGFAVGLGQCFGKDWIHVESHPSFMWHSRWKEYAKQEYSTMLARAPEHAQSMHKARSGAMVCIMQTRLRPWSSHQWTLRTCVVWKSPRENEVKLEVFRDPSFDYASGEWTHFDIDVGGTVPVPAHYLRSITVILIFISQKTENQDASHRNTAFDIDDSAINERGFTYRCTYPATLTGNTFILSNVDTHCVKVYSNNTTGDYFAVGFGQFFGKVWIHVVSTSGSTEYAKQYAKEEC